MSQSTIGLLQTSEFQSLLRRASREPLLKKELSDDCIPLGYSVDEVWLALTSIRKSEAYFSPNIDCQPGGIQRNWHTLPASLQESLQNLTSLTQRGTILDSIIEERKESRFITQQYIEEIMINLTYDGYEPDYESIRAVILGDRPCFNASEKIAANYHTIIQEFENYNDKTLDADLIRHFYDRLLHGISGQEFAKTPSKQVLPPQNTPDSEHVLDVISAIGNNLLTEPTQSPVMVSMLVSCKFWRCFPFSRCNNVMSSIMGKFYMFKEGFRAFCYLPKTAVIDEWKRLGTDIDFVEYSFDEASVTEGYDTDWTAYYDTVMKLMLSALENMQKTLLSIKEADDHLINQIDRIQDLNYRQQLIIQQAIVSPDKEFLIAPHGQKYGIVYSTARADLEQLVERGLFVRAVRDTANIYKPISHLHTVLQSQIKASENGDCYILKR